MNKDLGPPGVERCRQLYADQHPIQRQVPNMLLEKRKQRLHVVTVSAWPVQARGLTRLNRMLYGRLVAGKAEFITHVPSFASLP